MDKMQIFAADAASRSMGKSMQPELSIEQQFLLAWPRCNTTLYRYGAATQARACGRSKSASVRAGSVAVAVAGD
ncbi:hypothetical protein GUJ93_ZPchr0009g2138 [Zizania palustris]|uniref:Uncharacterized protein n=1 Tax=Zizania palustris TaxID=103762 RepID=A0A8J5S5B5_ZIZPA|nr:hypothetical protein GUJ93_ZPchr0009g2138 [Zizania palustris]